MQRVGSTVRGFLFAFDRGAVQAQHLQEAVRCKLADMGYDFRPRDSGSIQIFWTGRVPAFISLFFQDGMLLVKRTSVTKTLKERAKE